jgi:cytochrome d ubiquinol oxidase subunit I
MHEITTTLINWSRGQFALTAMFHWIFVPLTLGLGFIMAIMHTLHYRGGDLHWRKVTRFWQGIFGINFAIGIATGIILEFEFGANWSNYSWLVGDIFGAPLAIEGVVAFFMEATFVAVMFFGWDRINKTFHLASSWLSIGGATLSAVWIRVANAWMQHPVGMTFNPDMARHEMTSFAALVTSPFFVSKLLHTVTSSWLVGATVVVGISSWYLLKKRDTRFALDSIRVATFVGIAGILITMFTGDRSAFQIATDQPMKLAAMEGLYDGGAGAKMTAIGVIDSTGRRSEGEPAMTWEIGIPKLLSLLATHDLNGYVPGVNDIMRGGYPLPGGGTAISVQEKMDLGRQAIESLKHYRLATKEGRAADAASAKDALMRNFPYFGYGYFKTPADAVPNVPLIFYSFRVMVGLGVYFLALFVVVWWMARKQRLEHTRWLHWVCLLSIPLVYAASQAGWVVAEAGRQPWAIQDLLPVMAATSSISTGSVVTTFVIFLLLFTILLAAELRIMVTQVKKGPEAADTHY